MKLLNLTAAHDNRRQGEPSARAVPSAAGPTGSAQLPGERQRRRARLVREVVLALPPTLTVLGVLLLIEQLTHQRLLFASLAASAFLIYRDPSHPMNCVRLMLTAHLIGVALGAGFAWLLGPGYTAAVLATTAAIALLISFDVVHPPAIATALAFAFAEPEARTLGIFLLALMLLAGLVAIQRMALWIVHRVNEVNAG